MEAQIRSAPLPRLRSRKGQWLLALLVLRAGGEVGREWLASMLWPESPEATALANLRSSLKDLREALGPEAERLRSPTSRTLSLDLTGADVDVIAFDESVAQGDPASLEAAVALYRGPLLEQCAEEWIVQERSRREQAYLGALESLAGAALARGDRSAAERYLRRAVSVDFLRESAQRALMDTLAGGGNYTAAVEVYQMLRARLHREMGGEPDAETTALFQQIRAGSAA